MTCLPLPGESTAMAPSCKATIWRLTYRPRPSPTGHLRIVRMLLKVPLEHTCWSINRDYRSVHGALPDARSRPLAG